MKRRNRLSKWVALAVTGLGGVSLVAMVAMMAVTGVSLMTPDPAFAKFDVSKLTIGGDIRVRGEVRNRADFGADPGGQNESFAIQKMRLRFNYDTTSDVNFFVELQDSRVWGGVDGSNNNSVRVANSGTGVATTNAVGTNAAVSGNSNFTSSNPGDIHGDSFGLRQGYIGIKNAGVQGLNLKVGRQKLVFGDQRILGHFDWANVGWSFDGVRADYASKLGSHTVGWFRTIETECTIEASLCPVGGNDAGNGGGSADSDFVLWYNTLKIVPGMVVEPYLIYILDNRTKGVLPTATPAGAGIGAVGSTVQSGRVAPDQKRLMLGGRVAGKAMKKMIDYTGEVIWQTGTLKDGTNTKQTINAWATAVKVGVTLPVPMSPRIGAEYNYASGSGAGSGGRHTFENFWPTNHLHMGYMDQLGWKNMIAYSPQLKVKPTKASWVKVNYWIFRLAQVEDNVYNAGQGRLFATAAGNQAASLGQELDVVYSHKFKQGKISFQVGYGHFFAGEYIEKTAAGTGGANIGGATFGKSDQDWGYVSLAHKF